MRTTFASRGNYLGLAIGLLVAAPAVAAEAKPTEAEVRGLLLGEGYSLSIAHVEGLVPEGPVIVPYLQRLLAELPAEDPEGTRTAAFPFNVLLLLGWIGGDVAREELVRYGRAHPSYHETTEAAGAALDLRAKLKDRSAGLLMREFDLHAEPAFDSRVVRSLPPRTPLRIVRLLVPGTPGVDDGAWVEVAALDGTWRGYIERVGPAATLPVW